MASSLMLNPKEERPFQLQDQQNSIQTGINFKIEEDEHPLELDTEEVDKVQFELQLNSSSPSGTKLELKDAEEADNLHAKEAMERSHSISHGTYVCGQCDNELFSSKAKITNTNHEEENKRHFDFSTMIRKGALNRIATASTQSQTELQNSFQVSCSKCSNPIGREILQVSSEGQLTTSHYKVTQDVLRFVKGKKKS